MISDLVIDDSEIVPIKDTNLPKRFIAAAVLIDDVTKMATHSGIILKLDEKFQLFHFTGNDLLLEDAPLGEWYFFKRLPFIENDQVENFIVHCLNIKREANPKYGFYYPGSFYDNNGSHFSTIEHGEFMSCVGLCLNTIKGFIEDDEYFEYLDWDIQENKLTQDWIDYTIKVILRANPGLTEAEITKNIRRILPDEFIASAYLSVIPIRKKEIDNIIDDVRIALYRKTENY